MTTAYSWTDGNFTVANAVGKPRFSQPFNGDAGEYLLEQDFMQFFANFSALALNTAHPTYSAYYLVAESPLQDMGLGVARWTRSYMAIPNARSDYESYSWRRPGLYRGGTNTPALISSITNAAPISTIVTATNHGLVTNDTAVIGYNINVVDAFEGNFGVFRTVTRLTNTSFTCDIIDFTSVSNFKAVYVQKSGFGRNPDTKVVMSRVDMAYYVPGITIGIASVNDIPILNYTPIYDQYLNEVELYSAYTSPTQGVYAGYVAAKTWLVVDGSIIRRVRGNLYERATRYVVAQ